MEEVVIKPYVEQQAELEKRYHEKLIAIMAILIALLMDYTKGNSPTRVGLMSIYDRWLTKYGSAIERLNAAHAVDMYKITQQALSGAGIAISTTTPLSALNVYKELNVGVANLSHAILGRFIAVIPIGATGLTKLFTEEITPQRS